MYCNFCRTPLPHVENPIICNPCRADFQYYTNKLEDPNFVVANSKRCKRIEANIKYNLNNGGYIPPFYKPEHMAEDVQCVQCGGTYKRFGKGTSCASCKKLSQSWSSHVARGNKHFTSDRMEGLLVMYYDRHLRGMEVPRNVMKYIEALSHGELARLRRLTTQTKDRNDQKIKDRMNSI